MIALLHAGCACEAAALAFHRRVQPGFPAHGIVPVLKSYEDIQLHHALGHLVVTPGSFPDGPPVYFQCPLLPVK